MHSIIAETAVADAPPAAQSTTPLAVTEPPAVPLLVVGAPVAPAIPLASRRPIGVRALVAIDLVLTLLLLSLMSRGGGGSLLAGRATLGETIALIVATGLTLLALGAIGAYEPTSRLPGVRLRTAAHLLLLACAAATVAALVSVGPRGTLDATYLGGVALSLAAGWTVARVLASIAERRHPVRTLVVGTGVTANHVWELSCRHRECGFEVVGFVDDDPLDLPADAPGVVGQLADLRRLVDELAIGRVVVAYAKIDGASLVTTLRALDGRAEIQVVPRLYELVQARGFELGRLSLLDAGGVPPRSSERIVKRAFDIVAASAAFVALSPLLLLIALAIRLDDHGPVFFRQRRVGKDGRVFMMLKFRTMAPDTEQYGDALIEGLSIEDAVHQLKHKSVEMYVTRIGRRLRTVSLDELPQLLNVLRGDMGLVGPRPMPEYEAEALDPWQQRARHSVRPGITGLWQVSGRSSLSWDERVQLDCVYTRHWSVTTDLRIIARTIAVVLRGSHAV